ncbi:MAG: NADH-quinone oxidoreductase subunit NuoE [Thermodesulfobacteriota bacterium]|jgi:NADH-quinone oxidoreductase subunit E|nr:MAG: NADH-quinone oxidoreductase subunit NuoE [Thermodesulfobacteriota bacterium]
MTEPTNTIEEEKIQKEIHKLLQDFSSTRENLIPILQAIQTTFGFIPQEALRETAAFLKISPGEIFGVATFYNQFRFTPPGKHQVKVCLGTACHIRGGDIIMEEWKRRLQIKEGGVTEDHEFGLERVGCVGCCVLAPVVQVGDIVHGKMSPSVVNGILLQCELAKREEDKTHNETE